MKLKDACSLEEKLWQTYSAHYKAETLLCQQGPSIQSYGFSSSRVWMWESEHQRTDAFELWCWRRLLRIPWTVRRSNQSILKEIILNIHWKDWYWSWSSNMLATWCEEQTHWKRPWCWERLKAGGKGDDRGWEVGWHHRLNGHEFEQALGVGDGQESLMCCSPWGRKESDMTEQLNWTE